MSLTYTQLRFKMTFEADIIVSDSAVEAQTMIIKRLGDYFNNKNVENLVRAGILLPQRCNPNIKTRVDIVDYTMFEGTHLISISDKFVIHFMDKAFEDEEPCLIVDNQISEGQKANIVFEYDERYKCERAKIVLIGDRPYIQYGDDFKLVRKTRGKNK